MFVLIRASHEQQRQVSLRLPQLFSYTVMISTESGLEDGENEAKKYKASTLDKRHACSRTMSTRRVCWHRNTSVSTVEYSIAVRVGEILPLYTFLL